MFSFLFGSFHGTSRSRGLMPCEVEALWNATEKLRNSYRYIGYIFLNNQIMYYNYLFTIKVQLLQIPVTCRPKRIFRQNEHFISGDVLWSVLLDGNEIL